jgi:mannose-6-phosphate isomerase-like protein (cupin superfamily)
VVFVIHKPVKLNQTPIHIDSASGTNQHATVLTDFNFDGPSFERYIAQHCQADRPGRLVMIETSPVSWDTWECHPEGDEIVIVIEGEGEFIQQSTDGEIRIPVGRGDTVVNPKGVWHTADITTPIKAVYITPCPQTHHKPRD